MVELTTLFVQTLDKEKR